MTKRQLTDILIDAISLLEGYSNPTYTKLPDGTAGMLIKGQQVERVERSTSVYGTMASHKVEIALIDPGPSVLDLEGAIVRAWDVNYAVRSVVTILSYEGPASWETYFVTFCRLGA